jgi:hypothetical protein
MSSSYEHLQLLSLADVKTSAFGVVPVVELREWIDVLYLANKWNYTSIRSAALDAIRPLASCVDTEYKLNDWLPYALRELVTRTEGLTLAEGHRLGMEVVIMVAEARNNAKGVTSSDRVDDIVDVLCHALSTGDQMAMDKSIVVDDLVTGGEDRPVLPSPPQGSCSVQDVVTEKVQRQLMAWASNTHAHEAAGQHRLLKHLQDHPSHIQAAVGAVLRSLWIKQESWWKKHIGNIRYYRNADPYSCTTTSTLALLQGHCATECFSRIIGDFCTQAINSWQPINMITCPGIFENAYVRCDYHDSLCVLHSPFDQYGLPADFVAMMTTAHAVRYLLDSALIDKTVFSKQVFSGFWDQLLQLLRVQPEALHIVQGIRVTLTLMGEAASSNQVCQEIEDFYEEVGMIAEEGNSPVLPHLKACRYLAPLLVQVLTNLNCAVDDPQRTSMGERLTM